MQVLSVQHLLTFGEWSGKKIPCTVVMVTNLKEDKKTKCQQYWSEDGTKSFGPFTVTTTDQQLFADYTIRLLQLEVS